MSMRDDTVLWYYSLIAKLLQIASSLSCGKIPQEVHIYEGRMTQTPEDPDVTSSIRRVRRGCTMMAIIVVAMTIFLISATGNLAFSLLLFVAVALLLLAFFVVR
jgi:Na+/melibiose symporter-like transporter